MADEINRGIVEAHQYGIVTSASLLVNWPGAESAARLARRHPELGVGIHVDLDGIRPLGVSRQSQRAVAGAVHRQIETFTRLMGRLPTHIDSHHHAHLRFNVARVFLEAGERYGLPVRGFTPVLYIGAFYGQWPPGRTDMARIGPEALIHLLARVEPGLSQLACHPGYVPAEAADGYGPEREVELRSLTDPRVREAIEERDITLVSYRDYPRVMAAAAAPEPDGREQIAAGATAHHGE
jgi:predicted glycoside hydrolase/deacetylase ChbG (UPF0249 family)